MKRFWNWLLKNEGDIPIRELVINGTIAEDDWFEDDVTPKIFEEELNSCSGPVQVRINSPGGSCNAASQIYTMLRQYNGEVSVLIDGIAASAASVIAMAGSTVKMSPTAMMMIHNPATIACGNHEDMEKAIELLEEVKESIINAYEQKTGMQRAKISRLMDAETWMNAKKAVELGFADEILGEPNSNAFVFEAKTCASAFVNKVVAKYQHTPVPAGKKISDLLIELENKK